MIQESYRPLIRCLSSFERNSVSTKDCRGLDDSRKGSMISKYIASSVSLKGVVPMFLESSRPLLTGIDLLMKKCDR
jgi:hypothetical protein